MWLRAVSVWLIIIVIESIHGTLRQLLLAPVIGDLAARQVSVLTATVLIFAVAWLFIRWVRAPSTRALLGVGALWVVLTIVFEVALGRALGLHWDAILADYDPRQGGLMAFGVIAMFVIPLCAARLRRV